MQSLERRIPCILQQLRACFPSSAWEPGQARWFAAAQHRHTVPVPVHTETVAERETWKTKLIKFLKDSQDPLTVQALWLKAEPEGFRSKRHMKSILDDMRKRGVLKTKPGVVNKSFGFQIHKLPRGQKPDYGGKKGPSQPKAAVSDMTEAQQSWFSRG